MCSFMMCSFMRCFNLIDSIVDYFRTVRIYIWDLKWYTRPISEQMEQVSFLVTQVLGFGSSSSIGGGVIDFVY